MKTIKSGNFTFEINEAAFYPIGVHESCEYIKESVIVKYGES